MVVNDAIVNAIEDLSARQATIDYMKKYRDAETIYFNGHEVIIAKGDHVDTTGVSFKSGVTAFVDLTKRQKIEATSLIDKEFIVRSDLEQTEWSIDTESTKQILGKTCFRATKGEGEEKETAWFCPEIPIPVGPECNVGLPGLIMQLTTITMNYEATQIVPSAQNVPITLPAEKDITSKEKFEKARQKFMDDLGVEQNGGIQVVEF